MSFAVAAIGMTVLVVAESQLRLHGDLTRQRAEAVRLAHRELEHLRAFASTDELQAAAPADTFKDAAASTRFTLARGLSADAAALLTDVSVQWHDREGRPADVALHGIVAVLDPALSGHLVARQTEGAAHLPRGRSLAVPPQATDLGDGHSAFTPAGAGGITWIFDNQSGLVTSVCSMPPASAAALDSALCMPTQGLTVSGHVRFSTGDTVSADDAEHPASRALDLDLQLATGDGSATCFDNAQPGRNSVDFHCLVTLAEGRTQWSGRLDLLPAGWAVGAQPGQYRVCRYSADQDGRDGISNAEHPLDYRRVSVPLSHQNFLVVRGPNRCPADPAHHRFADRNTVEQAPRPEETPRG